MDVTTYVNPEMLVLIPCLYGLGMVLKETAIPNKHIPTTLTIVSVLLTTLYVFSANPVIDAQTTAQAIFSAVTQGILIASASVYTNEIIKQNTQEADTK